MSFFASTEGSTIGTVSIYVEHVAICGFIVFLSIIIGSGVPGSLTSEDELLSSEELLDSIYGITTSSTHISSSLFAFIIDYNAAIWSRNGGLSNGMMSKLDYESLSRAKAFQLFTDCYLPSMFLMIDNPSNWV